MQTIKKLNIVIFGLSITSSWGNGHATTFRSLIKALAKRGHSVTFFEKDVPWYASNRDLPNPPFCETILYQSPETLYRYHPKVAQADLVIMGSYVEDARLIAAQVNQLAPACFAFYDIDTPVTLAKLDRGDFEYLHPEMIPEFDLYLSFSGGPVLQQLEQQWGAKRARALYCSVDPDLYYPDLYCPANPEQQTHSYVLGYLGTYSDDRQPTLQNLLIDSARKMPNFQFCVAGAQYPTRIHWPGNLRLIEHIPPHQHRRFYNSQRFTLNVTRGDMIAAGYSPSVRLFEAAACATPIISDYWEGLDTLFDIGEEILIAESSNQVLECLAMPEQNRSDIAQRLRHKVMQGHTSSHRAEELEQYWLEIMSPALVTSNPP